jgi:hypothetical protein
MEVVWIVSWFLLAGLLELWVYVVKLGIAPKVEELKGTFRIQGMYIYVFFKFSKLKAKNNDVLSEFISRGF